MRVYNDQYIVITGGAGFIGSCLIAHLNKRGWNNFVVVDELGTSESWKNLVGKQFAHIIEKKDLFQWLEGRESSIEAFVHLGACSNTLETDASYLLENNYQFSIRLAEYAIRNDHRFIYASSAATYGDGSQGFSDSHARIEELRPLNMYGYSKHLFDLWVKDQRLFDRVTGLKFFNVFGPNEYHKKRMASAISHFLPTAQREGVIRLFKSSDPEHYQDGEQMRDFIYIKDVVEIIEAFLFNDALGIYNVGSGVATTWNTVAESVFKAIGKPVQIEYIDMPKNMLGKYQNYTVAEMAKARKVLKGAVKHTPFEKATTEYIQEYLLPARRW